MAEVEIPNVRHVYTDYGGDFIEVAKYRVKHRHIFNMKYLYIILHEWFIEEGWAHRKDFYFPETFMWKRETQMQGDELWFHWRFSKFPTKQNILIGPPGAGFWRYDLRLICHIIHLKSTEVVHQGQKYKTNSGEVEIKVRALLVFDQDRKWTNHWFLKHFKDLWIKRIMFKSFERHRQQLYRDAYRLQEAMKTYLQHTTYLPEPELQRFFKKKNLEG